MIYPIVIGASLLLLTGCATLTGVAPSTAPPSDSATQQMDHAKRFFVAHKAIRGGYEIIFHVMPAPEGMGFSRKDYHLMVSVLQGGKPLTNLIVSSDAKHPDGSFEPRSPMMQMGNWYMAHYNLDPGTGRHFITIAFDRLGKHYFSSIYYPEAALVAP